MTVVKIDVEDEAVATVKQQDDLVDGRLVEQLIGRAREQGVALTGEAGLLGQLTKMVLESALEGELTEHLGYDRHERAGEVSNARNGFRTKTVLTDIGPVPIEVPRDRDGSFQPKIIRKHQRRLTGVDEMVLSLFSTRADAR